METLFIADDEFSVREELKNIIDWDLLGFQLCGEAPDGEEALSQILALHPSLVLLDIHMPGIRGTEVLRRARASGFRGKCIIISGHADFASAQEAIKYGANFYLTKPVDKKELYHAVCTIRDILIDEAKAADDLAALQNNAKYSVLFDLLTNTGAGPYSRKYLESMNLFADSYQAVICEDFNKESAIAPYTFADLLKVTNRGNTFFEQMLVKNQDVVLLKGSHGRNKLSDFLEHFEKQPPQEGSPMGSMFLTYGRPVSSPEDIHLSYEDASLLLSYRFFCTPNQHTLGYDTVSAPHSAPPCPFLELNEELLAAFTNRLINYIQSFNRNMVLKTLDELENALVDSHNDITLIKLFLADLYLQIKEEMNRDYTWAKIPFQSDSAVIRYISGQHCLREIILFFSEQTEIMINAIKTSSGDIVLDDVLFYIEHNFQKSIKLETIAPLFGYNSAYLGQIFHKTVGESFNSYIDHKKIEYAKKLLSENELKVYEVAKQSGYKNVDYFHKKFKKYVGISPIEYRKQTKADANT